jgi:hypothetical protein
MVPTRDTCRSIPIETTLFGERLQRAGRGPETLAPDVVVELVDGKSSRARVYLDHGEALRAAGLSE